MTDKQIVDIILKRVKAADKSIKNPKIVLTQQYGKRLYFNIMSDGAAYPCIMSFSRNKQLVVFVMPELPERLMEWKASTIKKIKSSKNNCLEFNIDTFPKEIVHIFSSAIISALNTPGMGVHVALSGMPTIFSPDETYEEVQIEADMLSFSEGEDF